VPNLRTQLETFLQPEQILDREIDRVAFAPDASFYRLVPQAVLRPRTVEDVQGIFRFSRSAGIPVVFRAAGTSLSGQAITDGLLIDISRDWRGIEPLDGGRLVRVQPGAIGARVNQALVPFAARIGPDPASIDACMMGGILSNNASGMCCGVLQNSYHTLESLLFVLPSGTVIDTASPQAAARLAEVEPAITQGLAALRDEVRGSPALASRIRAKYRSKNTTGYSLNALVDFDDPVDILRHVLIGAEGTLAFIAEAVLRTVPDLPVKYTALLLFDTIADACDAIVPLSTAGAAALELMDRAALRSVQHVPGVPPGLARLPDDGAGVLVEFQEQAGASVAGIAVRADAALRMLRLSEPARFTVDPLEQALLWRVRKGMFPSVGAVRQRGTTVLTEDIAVPVPSLGAAVADLQALFRLHGYADAIIFGHARDGNLHFVLSQSFGSDRAVRQYARLMDDVVRLVVSKYDGALKAEHGTGRNMAPFVETEWGAEAYGVMKRLKTLIDPAGLLNPGVIINADPRAHLSNIKALPEVEEEIDRCIECGFCEPHCPSRDLTLTPRQRIVVRREMARSPASRRSLSAAFEYDALDTCATDGLCAVACPVRIDTGQLTRRLRASANGAAANRTAAWTARHFGATTRIVRATLAAGHGVDAATGRNLMRSISRGVRRLTAGAVPEWLPPMPRPAPRLPVTSAYGAAAIYFPACITRAFGEPPGESAGAISTADAFVAVAARAGLPLHIPGGIERLCCGTPYSSKGFPEAHAIAVNTAIAHLWESSREGELPVIVDTSPCALTLRSMEGLSKENRDRAARMQIVDAVEFFAARVLPCLQLHPRASTVTIHPVCSLVKMGLTPALLSIAAACAARVFVPDSSGCCGFAGDRGWLVPELTAAATAPMAAEVRRVPADGWYSSSRTCEIAMTRATDQTYRSWIHLVYEVASRQSSVANALRPQTNTD
jgi:D-lactate dehydrogenase